jgi:heptosyltransferase-2
MLTNSIEPSINTQHQIHYYLDLAKAIRAETDNPSIEIEATDEERANARSLLAEEGIPKGSRFLVVNAGAAYGSAKRWHEDRFAEVADTLAGEMKLGVAMIGSEGERSIAEQIRSRMKRPSAVLSGRTSLETLIGVAESSLMITNDSGNAYRSGSGRFDCCGIRFDQEGHLRPAGALGGENPVECSPCLLRECQLIIVV